MVIVGTGKLVVQLQVKRASVLDLESAIADLAYSAAYDLANGTGADQANTVFSDQRTLSASAGESLDLYGGLVDAFGATMNFTKIKGIIVKAAAGNTNNVQVGGIANSLAGWVGDAATDKIVVRPGGVFAIYAPDATGYPVTDATGDLLRVVNSGSGTSVTYDIVLIGCP